MSPDGFDFRPRHRKALPAHTQVRGGMFYVGLPAVEAHTGMIFTGEQLTQALDGQPGRLLTLNDEATYGTQA